MPGIQKSVLVVDDEPAVRDLIQALLRHLGHRVETATGGADALEKLERGEYDLVMTDFLMPGMKGDQLAGEIRKRKPHLPIILLTGHSPDCISTEFSLVLAKPFTRDDLKRAISALT